DDRGVPHPQGGGIAARPGRLRRGYSVPSPSRRVAPLKNRGGSAPPGERTSAAMCTDCVPLCEEELVRRWHSSRRMADHGVHLRASRRAEKMFKRPQPTYLSRPARLVSRSVDSLKIVRTVPSFNSGLSASIKAAAAATWGVAEEVPLKVRVKSPGE